jgi:hypothetical protein
MVFMPATLIGFMAEQPNGPLPPYEEIPVARLWWSSDVLRRKIATEKP